MRIGVFAISAALAIAAIVLIMRDLVPPKTLTFAAGGEGGGYWQLAQRYRSILARDGIAVDVLETAGSVENAQRLFEGGAEVALLQGGISADPSLQALAALFLEPMFFFVRRDASVSSNPGRWSNVTTAIGAPGSGTRAAFESLAGALGLDPSAVNPSPLGGKAAADALLAGEVEMAVFVAPISAPYLKPLFSAPEIQMLSLDHLVAISRKLAQSAVTPLPSGALSFDPPLPPETLPLLTMVATLAASPKLHPSLVDRLVEAAREIHSSTDPLQAAGQFPRIKGLALPVNAQARDLINSGPNPLHSYLPYWVVAQISRFAILIVPILILLFPLLRAIPGLYSWQIRHRVVRHYAAIREIEQEAAGAPPERLAALDDALSKIDQEIASIRLPVHYRDVAFTARVHIELLRKKIAARVEGGSV
ncbi:MAG: TAXI family TRAP transporter solute-binding subunit [Pseudomonadota bacterium]